MENNTIMIKYEDGTEQPCQILGTFEVGEMPYIALYNDSDNETVFYRFLLEGDMFRLGDIEDDAEFEAVCQEFNAILEKEQN